MLPMSNPTRQKIAETTAALVGERAPRAPHEAAPHEAAAIGARS